jgi:hypothetical protein
MTIDYRKLLIHYMAAVAEDNGIFWKPIEVSAEEDAEFEKLKDEVGPVIERYRKSWNL